MPLSFPVCQLLLWMAPNHFHFRFFYESDCSIDNTRLCVSSAWFYPRYLFSTPQGRSQQQTEILTHLLTKLAPVKDFSGVLKSYVDIFSTDMVRTLVLGLLRIRQQNTKATVPLDVVPERRTKRCSPRFRPGGRFWS